MEKWNSQDVRGDVGAATKVVWSGGAMVFQYSRTLLGTSAALVALVVLLADVPVRANPVNFMFFRDARVTIVAQNLTVAEILNEWGRLGRTKIVNADKLTGPPVTLELLNVPERQALDAVLRSASGYVASFRTAPISGASIFERILILPKSRPPARSLSASSTPPSTGGDSPVVHPFIVRPQARSAMTGDKEQLKQNGRSARRVDSGEGAGEQLPRFRLLTPAEQAGQRLNRSMLEEAFFGAQPTKAPLTPTSPIPGLASPSSPQTSDSPIRRRQPIQQSPEQR